MLAIENKMKNMKKIEKMKLKD